MNLTLRFAVLLSLTSVLSFAESWSGALVDTKCYATAQQNVSHEHPGSTDTMRAIRSCLPNEETKSFSIVPQVGTALNLNTNGNQKAHELVLKESRKSTFMVSVTGDKTEDTLKVNTISLVK